MVNYEDIDKKLQEIAHAAEIHINDLKDDARVDRLANKYYKELENIDFVLETELNDLGFEVTSSHKDSNGLWVVDITEMVPLAPSRTMLERLKGLIWKVIQHKMLMDYFCHIMGWGGPLGYWTEDQGRDKVRIRVWPYDDEGGVFTLGQLWKRDVGEWIIERDPNYVAPEC